MEGITKDVILYLMQNSKFDFEDALSQYYNSETFAKLSDEKTGLYVESSAYIYEIFKGEMKFGKIQDK